MCSIKINISVLLLLSYAINKTIPTVQIYINIKFTIHNNTENVFYEKRRLSYIMDKIELNDIEEKLLRDAYTSYLKNKKWCICHHSYRHSYSNEDRQFTKAKIDGLEHLKKIIFIEVDRCVGLTSYNILPDGIGYIQSK